MEPVAGKRIDLPRSGSASRAPATLAAVARAGGSPLWLLWGYILGLVAVGSLPHLPAPAVLLAATGALLATVVLLPVRRALVFFVVAACCGATWGLWQDLRALDQRLPLALHGADLVLPLEVVSLPQVRRAPAAFGGEGRETNIRFTARVLAQPVPDRAGSAAGSAAGSPALRGQRLILTWYDAPAAIRAQLRAGSRWQLPVRLKRPRGSVNPHTFDFEGWLLRRGIYATGYVRPRDAEPRRLAAGRGLLALRQRLRDALAEQPRRPELLSALLLGDRSGLTRADQQMLRQTGTAHLLAISGLHVGLVSGFLLLIGGYLARFCGMLSGRAPTWLPTVAALLGSGAYTLLAGAPLSARRALVMVWVLLLAWQWRRRVAPALAISLALALVLTLQPLAFYGAGFWLSFAAVGALLLRFSWRPPVRPSARSRLGAHLGALISSQWAIFVALLLPSLFFFSGFSGGGVLVNLVAIPWMGLVILPAILLGALLLATPLGQPLLGFAGGQLDLMMSVFARAQDWAHGWQPLGLPLGIGGILLAAGCVLLVILPRGVPGRPLGWLMLVVVPLLSWLGTGAGRDARLQVTALDVGQGLAVAVRTPGYRLVYDTGPRSPTGWSAGRSIVAPFLLGEGERGVDAVVISHADLDHAGGLNGLAQSLPLDRIVAPGALAGRLHRQLHRPAAICRAGAQEDLGRLHLQWLWPPTAQVSGEENDHSCVALLRWRGVRVLLSGDISRASERQIVAANPGFAPVDVLIAPHHGSRSSSSQAFVDWAQPRVVIFSAGFRHHFGHPHAEVVARYRREGAQIFNTAVTGAVSLSWTGNGAPVEIRRARDSGAFWLRDGSVAPWWAAR
ncbi:DNA internalization-related competence protein ComEC/Rec2 [Microbulbifer sp. SAOS-129_SWC]|uniref:DNA internalization-related competence protein ComEC/Rec2 n=1 Tax=Microbulbifer sp. SAOS-129_SWC TaxID=3145235 RepID=UPI003217E455